MATNDARYTTVVATRDWHAPLPDTNAGHFAVGADPDYATTWPVHCVAGSPGAEYHPDLRLPDRTVHVRKGQGRQDYSGFDGDVGGMPGATLADVLTAAGVTEVDIVGLATDHCVAATATDARAAGCARERPARPHGRRGAADHPAGGRAAVAAGRGPDDERRTRLSA